MLSSSGVHKVQGRVYPRGISFTVYILEIHENSSNLNFFGKKIKLLRKDWLVNLLTFDEVDTKYVYQNISNHAA